MKRLVVSFIAAGFLLTLTLAGCTTSSTESTDAIPAASDGQQADNDEHAHGDGSTDMDKMKEELAKLSPPDAAEAEKQHVCPVSGKMLGTMGAPQKVDVNGQQVWICCVGCKDELLAKPEEYLAKLKN